MKTLVIQSYRTTDVAGWIARCLDSVRDWAAAQGFDYRLFGDDSFRLCGDDYLERVGGNVRSITNLSRMLLAQQAHNAGYDRAIWLDADIFVFAPDLFRIDIDSRYAFARETWIWPLDGRWTAHDGVNNSAFVCMAGEPDLAFLISAVRHVALHRAVQSNYQLGGDLIQGLRISLDFQVLDNVGMFSPYIVKALAQGQTAVMHPQARFHRAPVYAANLCAGPHYPHPVSEDEALSAIAVLERTRGQAVNAWLAEGDLWPMRYPGYTTFGVMQETSPGA